jgi:polyisoprenoid-binding protein YceI
MTTPAPTTTEVPGYVTGRWTIDQVHSDVSFTARHMMISKVRGHFRDFEGEIVTGEDPGDSQVNATIQVASVDSNNERRDGHLRSGDFFDTANHPTATYRSTSVRIEDGQHTLDGELTLRGVTKRVPLTLEVNGFGRDPQGATRAGFTARGRINRNDFGVSFGSVVDGVAALGDHIDLTLEIEAILQPQS